MTVRDAVIDLLRGFGCDTLFGNPGSTELPLFQGWPDDIRYVLGLNEAVVVGMADGYAQATRRAAFVNLHSASGVGHAMGNLYTAFKNRAPVVVIAGQQARSLLALDPYLAATDATLFPRPYVKWAIEPARARDTPAAIAKAAQIALQEPRGPTFVSVPADDWGAPADALVVRRVTGRSLPDPSALARLGAALDASRRPCLVVGAEVDAAAAFEATVALAERYGASVWVAPRAWRCSFPETHPLFRGFLTAIKDKLAAELAPYDLALVLGAPVFTYHVESAGPAAPPGLALFQVTADPEAAAGAAAGEALVCSIDAAIEALLARPAPFAPPPRPPVAAPRPAPSPSGGQISPALLMGRVAQLRPPGSIIVEEAPSSRRAMNAHLPIDQPESFYTTGSGGLGYGLPAAVGIALAQPERRVVALIGDGSSLYAIQALWTAVRYGASICIVLVNNGGYLALKHMAAAFDLGAAVGADIGGIDYPALARSFGCGAESVEAPAELDAALSRLFASEGPALLDVRVAPTF